MFIEIIKKDISERLDLIFIGISEKASGLLFYYETLTD